MSPVGEPAALLVNRALNSAVPAACAGGEIIISGRMISTALRVLGLDCMGRDFQPYVEPATGSTPIQHPNFFRFARTNLAARSGGRYAGSGRSARWRSTRERMSNLR